MFCRNHRSRVTVARCSALEMEIRRGRFRRSMLFDTPQDTDIQKRIDHEVRMREGAVKLLGACSQREQALEAAKSLLVCNSRIMTYMSELQHRKEEQVLQHSSSRRPSDAGCTEDRQPCKGKLSISDLRIPLMWKDSEYFKNKGELHRCAVFCALQLRGEVHDTEMVFIDRTSTDICFENPIVFSDVDPKFELRLQLYSCAVEEDFLSGTPKKLATKLSSSLGRSSGRRIRAALDGTPGSPLSNGAGAPILLPSPSVLGPKFQLLAHRQLTLDQVQDGFRTHDLTISSTDDSPFWLPLYGSVCCRLTAQPDCMSQEMMSGTLQIQVREQKSWQPMFCVLRGCRLFCYQRPMDVDSATEAALTISVNKETRIRASDREGQSHTQSLSITNRYGCEEVTHTLRANSREELRRWMEAFWQHFYDMSQWKQCCDDLMKIETPPPKRIPAGLTKQGSLYHEMAIEGLGPVPDLLSQRMKEFELKRGLDPPPWTSFFQSPPAGLPSASSSSDCDSPPARPVRHRPRTLSLDAKLTSLKNRALRVAEQPHPCEPSGTPRQERTSAEGRGSSSSESSTPESDLRFQNRKSTRDLKTKLDPRNWLQSTV
ncbi:rhotekin isoform X2 [Bombina bombina]|uniref:rhotekin isoform X2 n=1 Tax=Bombina bombina TaxID=8345 RepID=UPI00235A9F25|nr:rhotekin isoform X2 [Bombina bombina]